MLKVTIAAALTVASMAVTPASAQIGSGATSNGYGYGNGPPGGGYPGGGYPGGGYPGGGYPQRPQTITCSSQNYARQRCPVDTRGGVSILQQQSKSACIQGSTWGYDPGGIWVRNGCVATFVVGRTRPGNGGGYPPPGPGGPGGARVIACSSINYQPARCAVDVYNGARLVKDISGSCTRRNWGWDRGGVWVSNGCRGRFEVF